jgi:hypothetical protein
MENLTNIQRAIKAKLGYQIGLEIDNIRGIMGDGTRIDRFVTFHSSGKILVTTENKNDLQIKIGVYDCDVSDDDILALIFDGLMEQIWEADIDLNDSDSNEKLRQATPDEIIESFIEGPTGHFETMIDGQARRVFAEF